LYGSSVCSIEGEVTESDRGRLNNILSPPGRASFRGEWSTERQDPVVAMTRLVVLGGDCPLLESHRRLLSEVDLSALKRLPPGLTLRECPFLERVRLPVGLEVVPDGMFEACQWLKEVSLGECEALRTMGKGAFLHCYMLTTVEVAVACKDIDLAHTGVEGLDLRYGHPDMVAVTACVRLRKLNLPRGFPASLRARCTGSMESLTMGDIASGTIDASLREVRWVGAGFRGRITLRGTLFGARVFGEVSAVGERGGIPALPC
jgi:hypothetical protein